MDDVLLIILWKFYNKPPTYAKAESTRGKTTPFGLSFASTALFHAPLGKYTANRGRGEGRKLSGSKQGNNFQLLEAGRTRNRPDGPAQGKQMAGEGPNTCSIEPSKTTLSSHIIGK